MLRTYSSGFLSYQRKVQLQVSLREECPNPAYLNRATSSLPKSRLIKNVFSILVKVLKASRQSGNTAFCSSAELVRLVREATTSSFFTSSPKVPNQISRHQKAQWQEEAKDFQAKVEFGILYQEVFQISIIRQWSNCIYTYSSVIQEWTNTGKVVSFDVLGWKGTQALKRK